MVGPDPGAGSRVPRGGRIAATVSRGQERFAMPPLAGLSRAAAETAVRQASLTLDGVEEKFSEDVATGLVLGASPEAGTKLKAGSAVDLVVSKGPAPIPVRSYVGRRVAGAAAALREAGFTVVVDRRHSDEVARGRVLAQDPRSGTGRRGDTVTLTESLGPVLVVVPNVRSVGVKAAQQIMRDAGFKTRVRAVPVNYLGVGYVAYTTPGARERAPKGSTITLHVV